MDLSAGPGGVIFDLDGVLVMSEHLWEEAWQRYSARHGRRWSADDTRRCQGMSVAEWSSYLAERSSGDPSAAATAVIGEVIAAYQAGEVPLVPGARDLLERLAARVPLALASSAPREIIDTVMDSMGLGSRFSATVSSAEVSRGKPSPDVYVEAVRRLGVEPSASVAVEDSSNGIRAAAGAGLRVIAIPNAAYPLAPDARALATSVRGSLPEVGTEIDRLMTAPGGAEPSR